MPLYKIKRSGVLFILIGTGKTKFLQNLQLGPRNPLRAPFINIVQIEDLIFGIDSGKIGEISVADKCQRFHCMMACAEFRNTIFYP